MKAICSPIFLWNLLFRAQKVLVTLFVDLREFRRPDTIHYIIADTCSRFYITMINTFMTKKGRKLVKFKKSPLNLKFEFKKKFPIYWFD
jgi:hypothetical protein